MIFNLQFQLSEPFQIVTLCNNLRRHGGIRGLQEDLRWYAAVICRMLTYQTC